MSYKVIDKFSNDKFKIINVETNEEVTDLLPWISKINPATFDHSLKNDLAFDPAIRKSGKRTGEYYVKWEASSKKSTSKKSKTIKEVKTIMNKAVVDVEADDDLSLIHNSYKLKPSYLKMSEAKWKVLVRSVIRGLNVMMIGEAGEGKTISAYALRDALQRPFFYVNLGNTQDAQTALIGKTHLNNETGTYFSESYFVKAIQTPNAIILLDEMSRASFDAMNILITVTDKKQRYLRLNDDPDSPTIKVAPGVSFIATANVGFKYSGTLKIDHAIMDRFIKVEVDRLTKDQRVDLLVDLYGAENKIAFEALCNISNDLLLNVESDDPTVDEAPSTRQILEMAEFIKDGFSITETLDVILYPLYKKEDRGFVRTIVQKYDKKINDDDGLNSDKTTIEVDSNTPAPF